MSTMRSSNQIAAKKNSFMIFLFGKWKDSTAQYVLNTYLWMIFDIILWKNRCHSSEVLKKIQRFLVEILN